MRPTVRLALPLMLAGSLASGCSSTDGDRTQPSPASAGASSAASAADPEVAALVPADIREKGSLTVGTEGDYPPGSFVDADGKTLIGTDIDFAKAIGTVLDLKVELQPSKFDTLIPGVQSGRYDMAASGIFDTKVREEVVDLVVYKQTGKQFYVKAGNEPKFDGIESLCGSAVAVLGGSVQLEEATEQSTKCDVEVLSFADQNAANLAVSTGRADVGYVDSPLAGYLVVQTNGQFELSGEAFGAVPNGLAAEKGSGLAEAVAGALEVLMANGKYDEIMKKWGAESDVVDAPVVNGAIS